jgi:uroporphyrinogen decarboxylase
MTSKERVHKAIRRESVDRVPIFMWFHPDTAKIMAAELGIQPGDVSFAFGDDVRQAWVGNNYAMEGIVHEHDGEGHTDQWGIGWEKSGPFNQITSEPLIRATPEEVHAYEYPYEASDELLSNMDPVMAEAEDYFVGCDVSPCCHEMVSRVRGMERAIMDLAADPELADFMTGEAARFAKHMSELAVSKLALDWLWTGDDIASQRGMIMSPEMWREVIRPHLQTVMDVGKDAGLWIAYHSCGAIRPIIPDLVEMGLNVLNPIQRGCPGMDPGELKADFGADLTFMGGMDTQDMLPNSSAAEVRDETARLIDVMTADGGGFILAASHTIPPETPFENIFAMYEAAGISEEEIRARAVSRR